eukprot:SAG31_NODE_14798_length_787_cov_0.848837_1_plen_126_part_00
MGHVKDPLTTCEWCEQLDKLDHSSLQPVELMEAQTTSADNKRRKDWSLQAEWHSTKIGCSVKMIITVVEILQSPPGNSLSGFANRAGTLIQAVSHAEYSSWFLEFPVKKKPEGRCSCRLQQETGL